MRRSARLPDPRAGFTLVELMVAMALIILIMTILSVAFQVGMDSLSQLKSIGGLSEQLRTAQATLQRDLQANHLEDPTGNPVRVSALHSSPATALPWTGLNRGYFTVTQRRMGSGTGGVDTKEGFDSEIDSWRGDSESAQTPGFHILRMTVQLSGQTAQETFSADAPPGLAAVAGSLSSFASSPNTMVSRWAEVVYFIRPNGLFTSSNDPNAPPMPVYTLYRRLRLLGNGPAVIFETGPAPPGSIIADPAAFPDLSWSRIIPTSPQQSRLNTPADITAPANRLGGSSDPTVPAAQPYSPALTPDTPSAGPTFPWPAGLPFPYRIPASALHQRFGSDVVLNNVVSFQVQAVTDPPLPVVAGTSPYQWGPGQAQPRPWTFDTAQTPPQTAGSSVVRLRAVQVKVRVYDTKNHQTRQITIVQDL